MRLSYSWVKHQRLSLSCNTALYFLTVLTHNDFVSISCKTTPHTILIQIDVMIWLFNCTFNILANGTQHSRCCSNYIFILDFSPGFNRLGRHKCKTRRESFKFCDLVGLIWEVLRYVLRKLDEWQSNERHYCPTIVAESYNHIFNQSSQAIAMLQEWQKYYCIPFIQELSVLFLGQIARLFLFSVNVLFDKYIKWFHIKMK